MRAALIFSVASVAAATQPTYEEWCAQYGKNGASEERKAIYEATAKNIEELNADGGATFAVNEYSDLTVEEWKQARGIVGFSQPAKDGQPGQCNFEDPDAPLLTQEEIEKYADEAIDWVKDGAVTPVKNQGSSGTCGYFSSITVVEGINVVQGKNELVSISEQENIDCCTPGNGGCNGWPGQEIDWYSKNGGTFAKTESSYRYKGSSQIPKPDGTTCYSSSGTPTTATTAGRICLANDPSTINAHLKTMGPAVWMIDASCLQSYSSGVLSSSRCTGSGGTWPHYNGIDHATTMVGSGTDGGVEYWKVKNSWGSGWGESGYYRVKKDQAGTSKPMLNAIGAIFGKFPTSSVSV
jgi:hypothetical protein